MQRPIVQKSMRSLVQAVDDVDRGCGFVAEGEPDQDVDNEDRDILCQVAVVEGNRCRYTAVHVDASHYLLKCLTCRVVPVA